jgi:DNA-binding MarR family transcriptional regulator
MSASAAIAEPSVTQLADALRPALLRVSRRLRQEAQRAGLSAQDALLLAAIKKNPGIGVSGLAEREQTSKPTMSGHVKRLEALGLIARTGDDEDARRSGLTITPAGVRKLDVIRRQRNDWLAGRLATLNPADQAILAQAAAPLLKLMSADQ